MRLNKFIALATGMSRRAADRATMEGRVSINGRTAKLGDIVSKDDTVALDGRPLEAIRNFTTIILNKPVGYVCSRRGQGSKTIYDLLPQQHHRLKPIGRLDKNSSGLILLTTDGELANSLTHPRYHKEKAYNVKLDKKLASPDENRLLTGVELDDGLSKFIKVKQYSSNTCEVIIAEGRNRQIRRTFAAIGYKVEVLHRTQFGPYTLPKELRAGQWLVVG